MARTATHTATHTATYLGLRPAVAAACVVAFGLAFAGDASARALHVPVGDISRPPIGWVEFCGRQDQDARIKQDCAARPSAPRDVVLSRQAWRDLVRVNDWVNRTVKPMTDLDQWGAVEQWDYPDTGSGDCEDYVLLKRHMLIKAGWPREALLITVVRDKKGDGHAVLTVKTDKGDFILDNQEERVLLWSDTGYRFVRRQSQHDPNVWVALGDPRPAPVTSASRRQPAR